MAETLEIREGESNFASVILDESVNGRLVVFFEEKWAKNQKAIDKKQAQRAYYTTDLYGRKLLNVSAIIDKVKDKPELAELLIKGKNFQLDPTIRFVIEFKKGRVDNVLPLSKNTKKKGKKKKAA